MLPNIDHASNVCDMTRLSGYFCILGLLQFQSCVALHGVTDSCCNLAKSSLAFLNQDIAQNEYICGQKFSADKPPALDLSVPLSWCRSNCWGYALYPRREISAWALPLAQFILPAVIFSTTIPRRLGADVPRLLNSRYRHRPYVALVWLLLSLALDAVILTLDTAAWVFTVMIATAPFMLSGLLEVMIDYRVTRCITAKSTTPQLEKKHTVQLLTAVLAGNLAIRGVPVNAQQELNDELDITKPQADIVEQTRVRLRGMLDCQAPFGAAVGAPVLIYIGSFIYSLLSLSETTGDSDTARSLAFGIWWMAIVHVSAISGSLLASNNPSTAAAIVRRSKVSLSREERYDYAELRQEMEDRIQAKWEAFSRLPLTYKARYEPVWMWTRGKNKAAWLRGTNAWEQEWFRDRMKMSTSSWLLLASISYLLVLIPCALAFWIEYETPTVGIGCRALTILVYACAQFVFVVLSAWSHFKSVQEDAYWQRCKWLNRLRRKWVGVVVAVVFLLPAWIAAVFTTFAGTLMQITGIFQNCLCSATFPPHSTVSLASDTQSDRDSSQYWSTAGYIALGFLFCVTYFGWWCQRYLRDVFMEQVDDLAEKQPNKQSDMQSLDGVFPDQASIPVSNVEVVGEKIETMGPGMNENIQLIETPDGKQIPGANGHGPMTGHVKSVDHIHINQDPLQSALSIYQQYSRHAH